MKIVCFQKLITKLGNVFLALCLLAQNSGPVRVADALTTQENNTTAAITSEEPLLDLMKGTQLVGTNTAFPSDSNEDGEHLEYVKRTGETNFIGVQSSNSMMENISAAAPVINNRILIDFSPYIDGQDPNSGMDLPESQIRERMQIIAPYSKWIRSFSCGDGLEVIGRLAHEMNLQVAVNAWIGSADADNQQEITCLINQANAGHVDMAIVGSEALLRGDVTPDTLITYIDQVRQAIPSSIPVTTADVYTTFLGNPLLVDHIDLIFANIYPFWEGYKIQHGVAMLNYYYNQLVATYPTKTIKISETGWPSCGSFGDAIGSLENEALYFSQVDTWARDKNVTLFYFDGLDESWKVPYEGPQGGCWGIWDKNGLMKEGMSSVFDGTSASAPYDLTLPSTCGTDQFSFNFTYVPPYGNFDNVQGQTCGIFHKDYQIMLYIKVNGGWWVKPYAHDPTTSINSDGSWTVDYTTGGIDESATEIRAYLVPTNEVGSCNPIGDSCDYPMISVTRPTDPNAFDKSTLTNGATNQPFSPILSWGSSANATLYQYCYDTTDDKACSNWTNNGMATTKVLSGLDPVTTYYWHVRAVDDLGTYYYSNNSPAAFWSFTTTTRDISPPTISNITRLNINPTNTHYVNFTVTFSESVTGVNTSAPFNDFALTTTGVTGTAITSVSGSGAAYIVTVNTGSGMGTIRLNGVDDDSIKDAANNPLGGVGVGNGDYTSGEVYTIAKPANIQVDISGIEVIGSPYIVPAQGSHRVAYAFNSGPVKVTSTNAVSFLVAERDAWLLNGVVQSFSEMMGLPANQVTDTYYFPWYNNVTMDTQLRFANLGAVPTNITVTIAGVAQAPITVAAGVSTRVSYQGINAGPVKVQSSGGVPIIVAERDAWLLNGVVQSFSEMMGFPGNKLTDTYYFPWYNNVTMDTQLRFANLGAVPTNITVTIAGVPKPAITVQPGQSTRVSYSGINNGPVKVQSSGGTRIIVAERDAWLINGVVRSFSEMMGLPGNQLTTTYHFPWYNNVTMDTQLRFANLGNASTDITVTIAGVAQQPITVAAGTSTRISYPVNNGPVTVTSSGGVPIIVAERDAWLLNGAVRSFSEMMGLPGDQLTTTYYFPWYNNVTMDTQLRFAVP